MKIKNIKLYVLTAAIALASVPVSLNAKTTSEPPSATKTEERAEAKGLINRLYEINDMRHSNLTASEKQVLGQEVKDINNRLKDIGGGIYISVGAIIIILLLLIIFL